MSDAAVLAANEAFYAAFTRFDLSSMDAVWSHGGDVVCVHPGWPPIQGWTAVRESWAGIFSGNREMEFVLAGARVTMEGDIAHVELVENVRYAGEARPSFAVAARNSFKLDGGRWEMVAHVAEPV